MMPLHANVLCITGLLWGESTSHWWISLTNDQWFSNLMTSLLLVWTSTWTNNWEASDMMLMWHHFNEMLQLISSKPSWHWLQSYWEYFPEWTVYPALYCIVILVAVWITVQLRNLIWCSYPDSKVHGANVGPIWGGQDPGGPHVGPTYFDIRVYHILCNSFGNPEH